jgi:hypothetical protein
MLGVALREDGSGAAMQRLVNQSIVDKASGNISMAKLRLDLVHGAQSLDHIEAARDRLPNNLVELFDAGIRSIEEQRGELERRLGVLAIAAAASAYNGIEVPILTQHIQRAMPDIAPPCLHDVLRAAKGFLVQLNTKPVKVKLYHNDFHFYVAEDYNESLFRARSDLADRATLQHGHLAGQGRELAED